MDEFSGRSQQDNLRPERRAGYAEWLALGAVVAGSVGAIVGAARCGHRTTQSRLHVDRPEPSMLTAPHGDKLAPARQ